MVRELPFATRYSHPEFIGSALSAPYVVPNNDSAKLPKDINVISACSIGIETGLAKERKVEDRTGVILTIDLQEFKRPDYLHFTDQEVIMAVAKAVMSTLDRYQCDVITLRIESADKQATLAQLLEKSLKAAPAED